MKQINISYEKFLSHVDVSRETLDKLHIYHDLLLKWQSRINLISKNTLDAAWERHFLDSAQLFPLLFDSEKSIFDLGSGAGFPGLVLSILGASQIHLIESDQRKCVFLSEVIRQTEATARIINARIESLSDTQKASIVTSRACASLDSLFAYAYPILAPDGECVFLKGRAVEEEIKEARKRWLFHVEQFPSIASDDGCIVRIRALHPR